MPFVFPSLSRAPEFANTRKIEDGTIKDPMESGYVATRPRFTRLRRVFGVSYKYLTAEDVRALDFFETVVVKGMAGSFYLPNQLPNGSFELPGLTGAGIYGWLPQPASGWAITLSPSAYDGARAVEFSASSATGTASFVSLWPLTVSVGESYHVCAHINLTGAAAISLIVTLVYADGTQQIITAPLVSAPTVGYQVATATIAIPPSTATADFARARVSFQVSGASGTVLLDDVGFALAQPAQPYGRMPGQPIASQVRFTKGVNVKDAGWVNGAPTYDVNFEVTEV